jgi:hypothetical protein
VIDQVVIIQLQQAMAGGKPSARRVPVTLPPLGPSALREWERSMGFATLRHVGTGDHLHVELPVS